MATTYSDDGKTYTSGGITYDMSSGRAINSEGEYLTEVKKRQQVKDKDGFASPLENIGIGINPKKDFIKEYEYNG